MGGRNQLSPRDKLRYLCGTKIQDVGNLLRKAAAENGGPVSKSDLAQALQACGINVPGELLNKVWSKLEQNGEGLSDVWKALAGLAPPRVGIQIERLLGKIGRVQEAQGRAFTNKNYKQAAELHRTERRFCDELDGLPLDTDISSSAHKVQERALMKQVREASTTSMKQNAEAALARFRELMKVGHTPRATPRGGSFVVVDYERPRTSNINCLIDLLPPDVHQHWRGTLRKGQLGLWKDRHDRSVNNYKEIDAKFKYQTERAEALAFDKAPFPPKAILERMRAEAEVHDQASSQDVHGEATTSPDHRSSSPIGRRPGTNLNLGSRPATSASVQSRPVTSSGPGPTGKGFKSDMFYALQALVAKLHGQGLSPARHLHELAGDTAAVSRDQLETVFNVAEDATGTAGPHVEVIMSGLDRARGGRVGVEELIAGILAALGTEAAHGALWPHPRRGFAAVSSRLWTLLSALQAQIKRRWFRGADEAFAMLDRDPLQRLERRDLQAVMAFLTVPASSADVQELWEFVQGPDPPLRGATWDDFRRCFGIRAREDDGDGDHVTYAAPPGGVARRLRGKRSRRSKSAPLESEGATEAEALAELMTSSYTRSFASARDSDSDFFSAFGPLRHRGYRARPALRPLTSDSTTATQLDSPDPARPGRRGVQWQVEGDPTPPRTVAGHGAGAASGPLGGSNLKAGRGDDAESVATIQPFTNFGSTLRMPWRRWAGGETLGPAKLPLQDPAAPGMTASLVPGTGEFQRSYEKRQQATKDIAAALTREDEHAASLKRLFPTGLSAGQGPQPLRPPSRASSALTAPYSEGGDSQRKAAAVSNAQGFLRKEMQDRGTAALIGEGTFWRDVGPPWQAASKDIGVKAPSTMPPLYENAMSKRDVLALRQGQAVSS